MVAIKEEMRKCESLSIVRRDFCDPLCKRTFPSLIVVRLGDRVSLPSANGELNQEWPSRVMEKADSPR